MNRRSVLGFLVALLLAGMLPALADDNSPRNTPPAPPITDPAQVSSYYHKIAQRPEFQETETDSDLGSRIKDRFSQWLLQFGARLSEFKYASDMPTFARLLVTIMVALAGAGLLYIVVRLCRRRNEWKGISSPGVMGRKLFRPPEFYEEEIQVAIKVGDWHAAWLATWRQFLSRLESRHLVDADRTRTNREYLAQLRTRALPASVLASLTGMVEAYDRFIYGRQAIGESDWNRFHQQVNEAVLLLHLNDPGTKRSAA